MNRFLQEVFEQPEVLGNTLDFYLEEGNELLNNIARLYTKNTFDEIIFTGMGSSFFSSYLASCLLNKYGLRAFVINASELLHYRFSLLRKKTLLVCVSQSGETFEIVQILKKRSKQFFCLGVTNEAESTLAQYADFVLLTKAGVEKMTSTKTYVTTNLVMLILGWVLSGNWDSGKINQLKLMIQGVENTLSTYNDWLPDILKILGDFSFLQFIARGPAYSSALQGALMFKEGVRTSAAGIYGGEFRHGPIEMVDSEFKAVVLAPAGVTFKQSVRMANDIAKFGGHVILITNRNIDLSNSLIYKINVEKCDEYLFPILSIVPLQLMVNQWALERGITPGHFSKGAKVTKIE